MASNSNNITIQIDEQALRDQIDQAISEAFLNAAGNLRHAADILDGGKFWDVQSEYHRDEYQRGFEAGKGQ